MAVWFLHQIDSRSLGLLRSSVLTGISCSGTLVSRKQLLILLVRSVAGFPLCGIVPMGAQVVQRRFLIEMKDWVEGVVSDEVISNRSAVSGLRLNGNLHTVQ